MPALPLAGIRIVDLTAVWAGPYATRILGDMGAEVIKVEAPRSPDLLRALAMLPPDAEHTWNKSAYFNHNNRNKKSVIIDLANETGRELFLKLVAKSDVVIENYRAEVMDKLNINYDVLKSVKEDIILVSMPGHGKNGPERDYVAYGTNVEQLAGLASLTGYVDGPPQKSGISYGDPVAGVAGASAVMMAILSRSKTGKGQYVEIAQRENLTAMIGEAVVGYDITKQTPERIGNRHPFYAPHGCYPAAGVNRWFTIACRDDFEFASLAYAMGVPELADDPRFADAAARHKNQAQLDEIIGEWTANKTQDVLSAQLETAGVPCAPVLTPRDIFHDEHLRARRFFERVTHAEAGEWDMERPVYRFAARPARIERNAPMFGEHNDYVFGEILGLSGEQIAELHARGITATEPDMSAHR